MPTLQTIDIDTLLNQEIMKFLGQRPSSSILREHILSLQPISSIQKNIFDTIQKTAQQEIERATKEQTKNAYDHQKIADNNQAQKDKELINNYNLRKGQILKTMVDTQNNLVIHEKRLSSIAHEISSIKNTLHIMLNTITLQAGHHHHNHHHRHHLVITTTTGYQEHNRVELEKRLIDLEVEQTTIHNAILHHNKTLNTLKQEEDKIFQEEQLILSRAQDRTQRAGLYGQSDACLTAANKQALHSTLSTLRASINRTCIQMQNKIEQTAHNTFVDAVEHALQNATLNLSTTESDALLQIISAIRVHMNQRVALRNAESELNKAQQQLTEDTLALKKAFSSSTQLDFANKAKTQHVALLNQTNKALTDTKADLLKWRDHLTLSALVLLGFTSSASGLAMLILAKHAIFAAILPTAPLIFSIIAITAAGLLLAAAITWISAAIKQRHIDTNSDTIQEETNQILENNEKIQYIRQNNPMLRAIFENTKATVAHAETCVQNMKLEVNRTYQIAASISLATPVVTNTSRQSPSFFQPVHSNQPPSYEQTLSTVSDHPPTYEEAMEAKRSSQNFYDA